MNDEQAFDRVEVGRALDHDLLCLGRTAERADWPASVREGFAAARTTASIRNKDARFQPGDMTAFIE